MILALQIILALLIIVLIILFVFKPKRHEGYQPPDNFREMLQAYVPFYNALTESDRKIFEERFTRFLSAVRITGANAEVEDLDIVLIGAAAIIPIFGIRDWEYINLREILLYPGNFNTDFDQHGGNRYVSGMVGTGAMQNVMILSKWELRQGFINRTDNRNVAIHEFVHLIDKVDGNLDGLPEILLNKEHHERWKSLLDWEMEAIRAGQSDVDPYGATSAVECFAVLSEYFFEQPERFRQQHPQLDELMQRIYLRAR